MTEIDRSLIRKIESENFPLIAIQAIQELRKQLDEAEAEAILKAREMGASAEDIAEVLGITRQGAYYRLKTLEHERAEEGTGEDHVVVIPEEHPADTD